MFVAGAPDNPQERLGAGVDAPIIDKFDGMVRAMGLERAEIVIASPGDAIVTSDAWVAHLNELTLRLRPEVVVALGESAARALGLDVTRLEGVRGTWGRWRHPQGCGIEVPVMVTHHPEFLLRHYTPAVRGEVWADLQKVMAALRGPKSAESGDALR